MLEELFPLLDSVRRNGRSYMARCPSHADKSPSLSIRDGERGLLVKCWAGCSLTAICASLGIEQRDLFFEALDLDPRRRKAAAQQRARQRQTRDRQAHQEGTLIDALREADTFVRSRRELNISGWSHDRLNDELNALADAYHLLESEAVHG
jgi:DNA primase